MTIEKGKPWGFALDRDRPDLTAIDDADLARLANAYLDGGPGPDIMVGTGDVAATIGVGPDLDGVADRSEGGYHAFPMDLGLVSLGHRPGETKRSLPFVAHVLGHRYRLGSLTSWPEVIVMNTPLAAGLRLGPRAHPNDGKLDVTIGELPWRQGAEARRRARTGTHLPHPALKHDRTAERQMSFRHRLEVIVDGVDVGRWSWIEVSVVPDAFTLVAPVG